MSRPKKHSYAALAPADVADAKRGRPDFGLSDYAAARGLDLPDPRALPAGFAAAVPGFPEYRFNLLRGVLPGGEYGVLFHQLLEVPAPGAKPSISAPLYGVMAKTPGSWWKISMPNRTDIPVIGDFLNAPTDDSPAEAFDSAAVWVPTTTAAINVGETALPMALVRIDRHRNHAPFDFQHRRSLEEHGLPGWHLRSQYEVSNGLVDRLLASPAAEVFRRHEDGFFQALFLRGTVVVRRNGFLRDPGQLDNLADAVVQLGHAARAAALAEAQPRPFADPLPPAPSPYENPEVTAGWEKGYRELAARLGLEFEDPDAYHRAFPSLGVPGRAVAVMRGVLPGTNVTGRLVYHAERSLKAAERARGAVLLPARPGVEPTPPGGARYADHRLVHEQRDGVAVLWSTVTAGFFREEQDGLVERAVALARERGLADV